MTSTDVEFTQTPEGTALRIEHKPNGPLIVVEQNGQVTVTRGPFDEAGKIFWDAVNIHGMTYRQRVAQQQATIDVLEAQVRALSLDPFKEAVHGSGEAIWNEIPKAAKQRMVRVDVQAVLDAINKIAIRSIQ